MNVAAVVNLFRQAYWLNGDRVAVYGRLFAVAMLLVFATAYVKILSPAFEDAAHRPVASDFVPFWSGARLAVRGHPATVYDLKTIQAEENTGASVPDGDVFLYQYPPTWLLLCLPLGLLPYLLALPLFLGLGTLALVYGLRRLLTQDVALATMLAFPGIVINAIIGQNGFVTASCFCAALLALETRPALAGLCLGLFAAKPHLAVCVPFALAAARRWSAFWFCALMSASLCLLSWIVLGTATWSAFLDTLWLSRAVLQSPVTGPKVITVYEAVRLLHGGVTVAAASQAAAAAIAIAVVVRVTARRPGAGAEISVIVAACILCTPYAMDYDLVCLAVPMAWLAGEALRTAWRPWEKIVLLGCYILPFFARVLSVNTGISLTPLFTAALLGIVSLRANGMSRS